MIEFRGSYRYASHASLERAVEAARAQLEDEDLDDAWLRSFSRRGTTLRVHTVLPRIADPFAAALLLETLARDAIEGVVDVREGNRALDCFPSGDACDQW